MILLPDNRAFPKYLKILDLRIPLHRKVGKSKKRQRKILKVRCTLSRGTHSWSSCHAASAQPCLTYLTLSQFKSFRSNGLLSPSPGPRSGGLQLPSSLQQAWPARSPELGCCGLVQCSLLTRAAPHIHGHKLLPALKTINTHAVTAFCRALPWAFTLHTRSDQLEASPERAPSLCLVLVLLSAKDTFLLHLTTLQHFYLFIFPNLGWRFSTYLDILKINNYLYPSCLTKW